MNGIFSASTGYHEVNTVHIALPSLKRALSGFNCSLQQAVQTPLTRFVQYFNHSKLALHPLL